MTDLPFNCYGESLDSTPDFFHMKRHYEESMIDWNEENNECEEILDKQKIHLHLSEQSVSFEIPLKENIPLKQPTTYEENILRDAMEYSGKTEYGKPMD